MFSMKNFEVDENDTVLVVDRRKPFFISFSIYDSMTASLLLLGVEYRLHIHLVNKYF